MALNTKKTALQEFCLKLFSHQPSTKLTKSLRHSRTDCAPAHLCPRPLGLVLGYQLGYKGSSRGIHRWNYPRALAVSKGNSHEKSVQYTGIKSALYFSRSQSGKESLLWITSGQLESVTIRKLLEHSPLGFAGR